MARFWRQGEAASWTGGLNGRSLSFLLPFAIRLQARAAVAAVLDLRPQQAVLAGSGERVAVEGLPPGAPA